MSNEPPVPVYPHTVQASPDRRPTSVLIGCVMAWVGSAVGLALSIFLITLDPDAAWLEGRLSDDDMRWVTLGGWVMLVLCVGTIVCSVLAFRRGKGGAWGLVVLALVFVGWAVATALMGQGTSPFGAVWALASAVLVYGNQDARGWFARR